MNKITVGGIVHFLPPYTGSQEPRAGLVIAVSPMHGRPTIVYWDLNGEQHIARDIDYNETLQEDRWTWPPRS